ncbi:hypothetical protein PISL3812_08414 [Talaromyces islandicus]|uniref:F-box domain-containing protein n=1 Tax=Talaromyces islandicus TaxID=28573 RepID=A0A0U1M8X8_TALIS|nr:hypothetical protein PISL3812_08414 [Talaromyces islandicus]
MAGIMLETLPAEVLLEIGTHLDRPSTLASFMSLNSRFYAFVKLHQETLVTEILNNFVSPELLPQALAVFEASNVVSWTPERTTHIISQFKGTKYIKRAKLSVKDGLNIQQRHEKILPIVTEFLRLALVQHPKPLVQPKPLSKNEKLRVERAFYRFELCEACKELTRSSVTHVILFLFSDTDLEQMVIITEFIQETKHWYGKKWEWDLTAAWMAPISSKAWTKRVVSFFSSPILEHSRSSHRHETLGFEWTDSTDLAVAEVKSNLVESYGGFIPPDTDKGPKNAWRWAHKFMKHHDLNKLITLEHRRSWGYALWDEQRLRDEWGLIGSVEQKRGQ